MEPLPQEWPGSVQIGPGVRVFTTERIQRDLLASPLTLRGNGLLEATGQPRLHGPRDALAAKSLFVLRAAQDVAKGVDSYGEPVDDSVIRKRYDQVIEMIKAPVYFWHHDMLEAALTMPLPRQPRSLMEPGTTIWLWDPVYHSGNTIPIQHVGLVIFNGGDFDSILNLTVFPCPEASTAGHNYHVGIDDLGTEHDSQQWADGLVAHGVAFIASHVAELQDAPLMRQERRALERGSHNGIERQAVSVIQLRRIARHTNRDGHVEHRDWASRWWVSGHWREQPVGPGRALRRPVWIEPYVKGPEDKPLSPRHRVFDIRR